MKEKITQKQIKKNLDVKKQEKQENAAVEEYTQKFSEYILEVWFADNPKGVLLKKVDDGKIDVAEAQLIVAAIKRLDEITDVDSRKAELLCMRDEGVFTKTPGAYDAFLMAVERAEEEIVSSLKRFARVQLRKLEKISGGKERLTSEEYKSINQIKEKIWKECLGAVKRLRNRYGGNIPLEHEQELQSLISGLPKRVRNELLSNIGGKLFSITEDELLLKEKEGVEKFENARADVKETIRILFGEENAERAEKSAELYKFLRGYYSMDELLPSVYNFRPLLDIENTRTIVEKALELAQEDAGGSHASIIERNLSSLEVFLKKVGGEEVRNFLSAREKELEERRLFAAARRDVRDINSAVLQDFENYNKIFRRMREVKRLQTAVQLREAVRELDFLSPYELDQLASVTEKIMRLRRRFILESESLASGGPAFEPMGKEIKIFPESTESQFRPCVFKEKIDRAIQEVQTKLEHLPTEGDAALRLLEKLNTLRSISGTRTGERDKRMPLEERLRVARESGFITQDEYEGFSAFLRESLDAAYMRQREYEALLDELYKQKETAAPRELKKLEKEIEKKRRDLKDLEMRIQDLIFGEYIENI